MEEITTIGLDIAKSVFQVHAISATGTVVVRRQLKRRYVVQFFANLRPCLVGIEACATAITGVVSWRNSGTECGLCRHAM